MPSMSGNQQAWQQEQGLVSQNMGAYNNIVNGNAANTGSNAAVQSQQNAAIMKLLGNNSGLGASGGMTGSFNPTGGF
jgi:hypothetical protein